MTPISDQLVADVRDQFEDMVVHGYNESYLNATARAIIRIVREAAPTPPVTGSVEPKPDGRNVNNRLTTLTQQVEKMTTYCDDSLIHHAEIMDGHLQQITDLQRQVQELTERVRIIGDLGDVTAMKTAELMIDRDQPTPPQPAAPRIDPEDDDLVDLIRIDLIYMPTNISTKDKAKRIAKTVASHLNGTTNA